MNLKINFSLLVILSIVTISCWGPIEPEDELTLNDSLSVYKDNLGDLFSEIDSEAVAGIPMSVYVGASSFEGIDSISIYYLNPDSSKIDSFVSYICSSYIDTILNVGQITFNRSGFISLFYGVYYADSIDMTIFDTINFYVNGNTPVLKINNDTVYDFLITELDTLKLELSTVSKYLHSKHSIAWVNSLPSGAIYDSILKTIIYVADTNTADTVNIKLFDSITVIVVDSSAPPLYDTIFLNVSVKDSLFIPINNKPFFKDSLPLSSYLIDEGDTLLISYLAEDEDSGDLLSYFITDNTLPISIVIDTVKKEISWITGTNDSGSYSITINATDGKDTASINVVVGVGNVNLPPVIVIDDYNKGDTIYIKEGTTLNFQVTANDANSNDIVKLNNLDTVPWSNSSVGEGSYDTISGAFSFLPYITAVDSIDSILILGPFAFKVVDNGNPPLSDEFSIYIAVVDSPIIIEKNVPVILTSPSNVIALEGDSTKFTVVATGSDLHYQWYCNDTVISDASKSVLTLYSLSVNDSGNVYKCAVYNSDSSVTSGSAILSILPKRPVITANPEDDTIQIGDNAVFVVEATGSKLTYQWYKNNSALTGEINDTLYLSNVLYSDSAAVFKCKVSNSGGDTISAEAILIVTNPSSLIYNLNDTVESSINDTVEISFSVKDLQKIKEIIWTDGAGEHTFTPDTLKDSLHVSIDIITGGSEGVLSKLISVKDSLDCITNDTIQIVVTDNVPILTVGLPDTVYVGYGDSIKLHVEVDDDSKNISYSWKFDYNGYYPSSTGDTTFILKKTMPYTQSIDLMIKDDDNNVIYDKVIIIGDIEFTPKMCNFTFSSMYALENWKGVWYIHGRALPNPASSMDMFTFYLLKSTDLLNWEPVSGFGGSSCPVGYNDKYYLQMAFSAPIGYLNYSTDMDTLLAIDPTPPFTFSTKAPDILSINSTSYVFADSGLYVLDPENTGEAVSKVAASPFSTHVIPAIPNCKSDSLVYFIADGTKLYKLRENSSNPYELIHEMNVDSIGVGDILIEDGILWLFTPETIKCSKDFGASWFTITNSPPWSTSICLQVTKDDNAVYIFTTKSGNENVYKYTGPLIYP